MQPRMGAHAPPSARRFSSMSSRFCALAIPGEAFHLETFHGGRRWSVLVDGGQHGAAGKRHHPLLKALSQTSPKLNQIDIAICTHNDADHAAGFPSFIEEWLRAGNKVAEVWLPWKWSAALPTALTDPDGLIYQLAVGALAAAAQIERSLEQPQMAAADGVPHMPNPESLIRQLGRETLNKRPAGIEADPEHWNFEDAVTIERFFDRHSETKIAEAIGLRPDWSDANNLLEETDHATRSLIQRESTYARGIFEFPSPIAIRAWSLFHSVLETAERIRAIAEIALRKGVLIRWFDFDAFENGSPASGGISGFFVPVNAVEMIKPKPAPDPLALLFSLRLTQQNVESLVFQRIETDTQPGVFFLSDSRLAFGVERPANDFPKPQLLPSRRPVITAAHHGSRVNDRAYEVLGRWLSKSRVDDYYFVRNGGMWKQTLGAFLSKKHRRCAQCQQCQYSRTQHVILEAKTGDWSWPPAAHPCGTPKANAITITL